MIQVPKYVQFILDTLEANGFSAYIVGGSVRDALRGKAPDDFDVTTDAEPDAVRSLFEGTCRVILTGLKHGTVTVLSDGKPIEVTTFRTDGDYEDNRHPQNVAFVKSLEFDLARRDFTVNAMAYSPTRGLVDLYGGQADLDARVLRCVGEPARRFQEDALRMLRALRFASVLQFEIEEKTASAIHENRALLNNVSAERIRTELFKLLTGADAEKLLLAYPDVFFTLFPKLESAYTGESFVDAIKQLHTLENDAVLRFAALLQPIAKEHPTKCFSAIEILKTDKKSADKIKFTVLHAGETLPTQDAAVKYALNRFGEEQLVFFSKLNHAQETIDRINAVLQSGAPYRICDLDIGGDDVINAGYSGKQIGEVLDILLRMVIHGQVKNEKEALLNAIKNDRE